MDCKEIQAFIANPGDETITGPQCLKLCEFNGKVASLYNYSHRNIQCGYVVKGFNQCVKNHNALSIILSHVHISMAKGQMHLMQFKDDKED